MKYPNMLRTGVVKRSGNPNSSNTVNGLAIIHGLVFLIVQISNLNEGKQWPPQESHLHMEQAQPLVPQTSFCVHFSSRSKDRRKNQVLQLI